MSCIKNIAATTRVIPTILIVVSSFLVHICYGRSTPIYDDTTKALLRPYLNCLNGSTGDNLINDLQIVCRNQSNALNCMADQKWELYKGSNMYDWYTGLFFNRNFSSQQLSNLCSRVLGMDAEQLNCYDITYVYESVQTCLSESWWASVSRSYQRKSENGTALLDAQYVCSQRSGEVDCAYSGTSRDYCENNELQVLSALYSLFIGQPCDALLSSLRPTTTTTTTTTSTRAPTTTSAPVVFTQAPVTSSGSSLMDGSILQTCAGTLFPPGDMPSNSINFSDTSQVMNWTFGIVCRHYHDYFSCIRTEMDKRQNLTTFDSIVFGVMDIAGAESGYSEMCSNLDYIVENAACMTDLGQSSQLSQCVGNSVPTLIGMLELGNQTSLCSDFASYTNCLQKPLSEMCDEEFASFLYNITLRSLRPKCRGLVTGGKIQTSTTLRPQTSIVDLSNGSSTVIDVTTTPTENSTSTIVSSNRTFTPIDVTTTMSTKTTNHSLPGDPSKGTELPLSVLVIFMMSLTSILLRTSI